MYYYTRDINQLFEGLSTRQAIKLKDDVQFNDPSQTYQKRFYQRNEYSDKIKKLSQYYKFHTDIARIFMNPYGKKILHYQNWKRKVNFKQLSKKMKEDLIAENKDPNELNLSVEKTIVYYEQKPRYIKGEILLQKLNDKSEEKSLLRISTIHNFNDIINRIALERQRTQALQTLAANTLMTKPDFISGIQTFIDMRSIVQKIQPQKPKEKKYQFEKKVLQQTIPKDILQFLEEINKEKTREQSAISSLQMRDSVPISNPLENEMFMLNLKDEEFKKKEKEKELTKCVSIRNANISKLSELKLEDISFNFEDINKKSKKSLQKSKKNINFPEEQPHHSFKEIELISAWAHQMSMTKENTNNKDQKHKKHKKDKKYTKKDKKIDLDDVEQLPQQFLFEKKQQKKKFQQMLKQELSEENSRMQVQSPKFLLNGIQQKLDDKSNKYKDSIKKLLKTQTQKQLKLKNKKIDKSKKVLLKKTIPIGSPIINQKRLIKGKKRISSQNTSDISVKFKKRKFQRKARGSRGESKEKKGKIVQQTSKLNIRKQRPPKKLQKVSSRKQLELHKKPSANQKKISLKKFLQSKSKNRSLSTLGLRKNKNNENSALQQQLDKIIIKSPDMFNQQSKFQKRSKSTLFRQNLIYPSSFSKQQGNQIKNTLTLRKKNFKPQRNSIKKQWLQKRKTKKFNNHNNEQSLGNNKTSLIQYNFKNTFKKWERQQRRKSVQKGFIQKISNNKQPKNIKKRKCLSRLKSRPKTRRKNKKIFKKRNDLKYKKIKTSRPGSPYNYKSQVNSRKNSCVRKTPKRKVKPVLKIKKQINFPPKQDIQIIILKNQAFKTKIQNLNAILGGESIKNLITKYSQMQKNKSSTKNDDH